MALKSTGYLASASNVAWTSGQGLDSLTDDEWTDLSDEIDNTTNLYTMADFRCVLGSAAFTGTDSILEAYIIPTVDGTNYPKWAGNVTSDEQQNDKFFVGTFSTTGATEAQEDALSRVILPPGKFKVGFRNKTNVTLAASGNAVSWRPHSYKDV